MEGNKAEAIPYQPDNSLMQLQAIENSIYEIRG